MILVECYPDKKLVEIMGFKALHSRERGRAIAGIRRGKSGSCVCLVDLDFESSLDNYVKGQVVNRKRISDLGIRVLCLSRGIVISLENNLEEFIIASAREAGVSLGKYNLSNDPASLHSQITGMNVPNRFIELLNDLNEKSRRMEALREILERAEKVNVRLTHNHAREVLPQEIVVRLDFQSSLH